MVTNNHTASNFEKLNSQEWLVTNGIGGYASSTVIGCNTRRYHGLLIAAVHPPAGRMALVSKVEESLVTPEKHEIPLSTNHYPGTVHPEGYQYFNKFDRKPVPTTFFKANGYALKKTVSMAFGSNTTIVVYENIGESLLTLRLTPWFVYRDFHGNFREDKYFDFWYQLKDGYYAVYPHYDSIPVYFKYSFGEFYEHPVWYNNLVFDRENERGFFDLEDTRAIGQVTTVLKPGERVHLVFSTDESIMMQNPSLLVEKEITRLEELPKHADPFINDLLFAGEQFIVSRKLPSGLQEENGYSLIAGYHWFADWGRDTMIAMRGLTIAAGRQEISADILRTFFQYIDKGMLPNRFPDQGEVPEYNTIDATLWLFIALYEYYNKFQDLQLIEAHFEKLTDVLDQHISGTRYGIKATEKGFLSGGEGNVQLTWMDARVGDYVVTPRHGCPVEIQALWYNALRIYQYFAGTLGRPYEDYKNLADLLAVNFKKEFFRSKTGLIDNIGLDGKADPAIRPNQIFVVSLPFSLLGREEEKVVVTTVKKHLLTSYGLRTLSPEHPDFKADYGGDVWHRDTAYHQGTVWPFLLGEYISAYLKVNDWSEKAKKESYQLIEPLRRHFYQQECIMGISEIFDGKQPSAGKGAIHQAWSIGMLVKILLELDRLKTNPTTEILLLQD